MALPARRSGRPSSWEPALAATMRPNQLAEQVLAGFRRAVESLHRPLTGLAGSERADTARDSLDSSRMGDLFDEFMRELERRRAEAEGRSAARRRARTPRRRRGRRRRGRPTTPTTRR